MQSRAYTANTVRPSSRHFSNICFLLVSHFDAPSLRWKYFCLPWIKKKTHKKTEEMGPRENIYKPERTVTKSVTKPICCQTSTRCYWNLTVGSLAMKGKLLWPAVGGNTLLPRESFPEVHTEWGYYPDIFERSGNATWRRLRGLAFHLHAEFSGEKNIKLPNCPRVMWEPCLSWCCPPGSSNFFLKCEMELSYCASLIIIFW